MDFTFPAPAVRAAFRRHDQMIDRFAIGSIVVALLLGIAATVAIVTFTAEPAYSVGDRVSLSVDPDRSGVVVHVSCSGSCVYYVRFGPWEPVRFNEFELKKER